MQVNFDLSVRQGSSLLTLLVLVAEAPGLVGAGGPRASVDLGELAVLPAADAEQVPQHVALLLAVKLGHVFVRPHPEVLRGVSHCLIARRPRE